MTTKRRTVSAKRTKYIRVKFLKVVVDKPRMTLINLDKTITDILG